MDLSRPFLFRPFFPSEIPHEGPMADLVWSDPDPEKEDFAISPRFAGCLIYSARCHLIYCLTPGGRDTPSAPGSCTSFSRLIACPIYSARTSFVWRDTRPCSINTFPLFGPRQITVIAVEMQRVYWKWAQAARCTLTSLMQHRRTRGTGRINRLPRMLVAR